MFNPNGRAGVLSGARNLELNPFCWKAIHDLVISFFLKAGRLPGEPRAQTIAMAHAEVSFGPLNMALSRCSLMMPFELKRPPRLRIARLSVAFSATQENALASSGTG